MPATSVLRAHAPARALGQQQPLPPRQRLRRALPALACVALAACGGGGSDGGAGNEAGSGPSNTAPVISGAPVSVAPAGTQYTFMPTASDADRDTLSFKIDNPPAWATFSEADGSLSGAPSQNDVGTYRGIVITVTDGIAESSIPPFEITVTAGGDQEPPPPQNSRPQIAGTPTTQTAAGAAYSFTPSASDADGDTLSFTVANAPAWASFSSTTGTLSGTPDTNDIGSYPSVVITVSDGLALASLAPFTITVSAPDAPPPPANQAPTISGVPPSDVLTGDAYLFTPSASDGDGDALVFAAANLPPWASLSPTTGALSGTPTPGDEGVYSGIIVAVSDGTDSAALPAFSITVQAPPNAAPTINGTPDTEVVAGNAYSFTPTADDADGDTLTFSIDNAPSWADFSSATGTLSGTPLEADVGTYANIVISVSDGTDSTSLAAFTIEVTSAGELSVTLDWNPPTENTDDSALTDLTSYRIYIGVEPGNYTDQVAVDNPGLSSFVVERMDAGTYYFAITAVNSLGIESDFSNEVTVTLPMD